MFFSSHFLLIISIILGSTDITVLVPIQQNHVDDFGLGPVTSNNCTPDVNKSRMYLWKSINSKS